MDNNHNYFLLSGFIALSLFFGFFALFIYMLFSVKDMSSYALKKDNFISISLNTPVVSSPKTEQKVSSATIQESRETENQNIDVNDLFSDVWTKKIVPKKEKKVNSKRLLELQKKIKKVDANKVKSISKSINESKVADSSKEVESASTANEVNEYLAKIQAIVYQHFFVPENSQGNSVKTVIELNALGKVLDFRILRYSQSSALNTEADKMKERLRSVVFPINPENKPSRTVVILISKE